jgi:hypothetical protein
MVDEDRASNTSVEAQAPFYLSSSHPPFLFFKSIRGERNGAVYSLLSPPSFDPNFSSIHRLVDSLGDSEYTCTYTSTSSLSVVTDKCTQRLIPLKPRLHARFCMSIACKHGNSWISTEDRLQARSLLAHGAFDPPMETPYKFGGGAMHGLSAWV